MIATIEMENGGIIKVELDEKNLRTIMARLNPSRHPVYILLPRQEYAKRRSSWRLP